MRGVLRVLVVLQMLVPTCAFAAEEKVRIELNSIENADDRCRLNFVIENKSHVAIESMKLDLVAFGDQDAYNRAALDTFSELGKFDVHEEDADV